MLYKPCFCSGKETVSQVQHRTQGTEIPAKESAEEEAPLGDSLDDLFSFGEEDGSTDGDELSKLFDEITLGDEDEDESEDEEADLKSLREGLDDLFDL